MSLRLVKAFGPVDVLGQPILGRRRFGVPVGGAFDEESWQVANVLAGVSIGQACWELSMAQAKFEVVESCTVGVAGAPAPIRLASGLTEASAVFTAQKGDTFVIEPPPTGARAYIACGPVQHPQGWVRRTEEPLHNVTQRHLIRVMAGPNESLIGIEQILSTFKVSRSANRVGIRLEPRIAAHTYELTSTPQCVGVIQVSNDGTLIMLGPDGPTIGGYPMAAAICSSDLGRIGQLRPGDSVTFQLVTAQESLQLREQAALEQQVRLNQLRLALSV